MFIKEGAKEKVGAWVGMCAYGGTVLTATQ